MLTKEDINTIIKECGEVAKKGLNNGHSGLIQPLQIDFLVPPEDFIGVGSNPAIYVSQTTYKLLSWLHKHWIPDQTIAVQQTFLKETPLRIIGIVSHEMGHAFNVSINIPNTEANAYVFEIEVIKHLVKNNHPLIASYSKEDVMRYFESRLPNYEKDKPSDLDKLIVEIKQGLIFKDTNHVSQNQLQVIHKPSLFLTAKLNLFSKNNTNFIANHYSMGRDIQKPNTRLNKINNCVY